MATDFALTLLRKLGRAGLLKAKPNIPSSTLRRALRFLVTGNSIAASNPFKIGSLFITHYWAVMVHDGHKPLRPIHAQLLVGFRDPSKDPRFSGSHTPARRKDIRRLTPKEFADAAKLNRAAKKRGVPKTKWPVIITKGPTRRGRATPFFGNRIGGGMQGFGREASAIAVPAFSKHVLKTVGKSLVVKDSATAFI